MAKGRGPSHRAGLKIRIYTDLIEFIGLAPEPSTGLDEMAIIGYPSSIVVSNHYTRYLTTTQYYSLLWYSNLLFVPVLLSILGSVTCG